MEQPARNSRKRVPLQPLSDAEIALREVTKRSEDQAKAQDRSPENSLPSRKGADHEQLPGDKQDNKSKRKSDELAICHPFLAAPLGSCPQELSVEEVCSHLTGSSTDVFVPPACLCGPC